MDFKALIMSMVGDDFELEFTGDDIVQTYKGKPFTVSVKPRNGYIKVSTSLENGWPFLQHVIEKNKLTAMSIRYFENEVSEFSYWVDGQLVRMQHALKDSKWVWYGKGELQEWEDQSQCSNRVIKDRLTAKMLWSYLEKCGYTEGIA